MGWVGSRWDQCIEHLDLHIYIYIYTYYVSVYIVLIPRRFHHVNVSRTTRSPRKAKKRSKAKGEESPATAEDSAKVPEKVGVS